VFELRLRDHITPAVTQIHRLPQLSFNYTGCPYAGGFPTNLVS